ncbi:MAG: DUF5063 domain-containing protein [Paludibacteraceae bacterium]|nr:DUF5063 domain-containing protein [Paludibacteraceae bacterium]
MSQSLHTFVYRSDVIEFVTVAVQTCLLLEHIEEQEKQDAAEKLLLYLPLLYQKTRAIVLPEEEPEGFQQQFVTEEDYNYISEGIKQMLGSDDVYLEVFVEDMRYSAEPVSAFISENLADIYQELKDMAGGYQTENLQVMQDSVIACVESFHMHWGQKLLNAMRALHSLVESGTLKNEE